MIGTSLLLPDAMSFFRGLPADFWFSEQIFERCLKVLFFFKLIDIESVIAYGQQAFIDETLVLTFFVLEICRHNSDTILHEGAH